MTAAVNAFGQMDLEAPAQKSPALQRFREAERRNHTENRGGRREIPICFPYFTALLRRALTLHRRKSFETVLHTPGTDSWIQWKKQALRS
ncbi:unnamed protein product [Lota lota]